jgi:hypothetical protein
MIAPDDQAGPIAVDLKSSGSEFSDVGASESPEVAGRRVPRPVT